MPSRNIERVDLAGGFYHIYGRGAARRLIFVHDDDRQAFLDLVERYLGAKTGYDANGDPYPSFRGKVELMAYCLMGTHFHLLIHQVESGYISEFMKSLIGSYTRYFNRKHQSRGALLESRYRASLIKEEPYLVNLTRYIHLNPDYYDSYIWSSLKFFYGASEPDWLSVSEFMEITNLSPDYYRELMKDYEELQEELKEVNLADSGENLVKIENKTPF